MSELIYLCPDCGSPLVEVSFLANSPARCKVCPWRGKKEGLAAIPLESTGLGSSEEIILAVNNDIRKIVREAALPLTRFLVKWGFVDAVQVQGNIQVRDQKQVLRYVNAIARGIFKSIFDERVKVELEKGEGRRG